ncbi:hypothetical protein BKA65DRAFT_579281 [Rhexocercosporidium sp. MPI-PUGE-AT-0058]|nr:hypothetical protein BKA65DRAFT_579281 [Rhexocercosporidium sp. MPI-PUGE-AT-0058]
MTTRRHFEKVLSNLEPQKTYDLSRQQHQNSLKYLKTANKRRAEDSGVCVMPIFSSVTAVLIVLQTLSLFTASSVVLCDMPYMIKESSKLFDLITCLQRSLPLAQEVSHACLLVKASPRSQGPGQDYFFRSSQIRPTIAEIMPDLLERRRDVLGVIVSTLSLKLIRSGCSISRDYHALYLGEPLYLPHTPESQSYMEISTIVTQSKKRLPSRHGFTLRKFRSSASAIKRGMEKGVGGHWIYTSGSDILPNPKIIGDKKYDGEIKVKTAIICPPTIWGKGRGSRSTRSHQIYEIARLTLEKDSRIQLLASSYPKTFWPNIHIHDMAKLYLEVRGSALAELQAKKGKATWNKEGYYFAENGVHYWQDIADWIADEAVCTGKN